MGAELSCRARVRGVADSGKALLETDELLFRGKQRLAVRFADTRAARVEGEWLILGPLQLELGAKQAARWAQTIAAPKSVLEKLGVKPGLSAVLLGAVPADFIEQLQQRGVQTTRRLPARAPQLVFFFVARPAELKKLPKIDDEGALWLIREKGKSAPVSEQQSRAAARAAGLVDVKVVSFSASHSAEKYVVPVQRRESTR
jgi:hypothetical protein